MDHQGGAALVPVSSGRRPALDVRGVPVVVPGWLIRQTDLRSAGPRWQHPRDNPALPGERRRGS